MTDEQQIAALRDEIRGAGRRAGYASPKRYCPTAVMAVAGTFQRAGEHAGEGYHAIAANTPYDSLVYTRGGKLWDRLRGERRRAVSP